MNLYFLFCGVCSSGLLRPSNPVANTLILLATHTHYLGILISCSVTYRLQDSISLSDIKTPAHSIKTKYFQTYVDEPNNYRKLAEASSLEDFLSLAVYVRDRYNPYVFLHILLTVLLHRPDTSGMSVPCMAQVNPEIYIDEDTLGRVAEENFVNPTELQVSFSPSCFCWLFSCLGIFKTN